MHMSLRRKIAVVGAAALALFAGNFVWNKLDNAGDVSSYGPTQPINPVIDNVLRAGSWNMHNELSARFDDIREILDGHKLDVLALQEVGANDARKLQYEFPDWYTTFVMADSKVEPLEGGYGNVLMSRQKPENISSTVIDGTSMSDSVVRFFSGLGVDMAQANTALTRAKEGVQEDRASVAITIKIQSGSEQRDVRVITGHISAHHDFHEKQLQEQMEFVRENVKDGRPLVFLGDMNSSPSEFIPEAADIGMITPETAETSLSGRVIDYASYRTEGVLELAKVTIEPRYTTDHRLLIMSTTSTG